ncbi:epilancin biosynthesis-related protein ElxI1, partial [Staphylococcus epidermidis]
MTLLTKLLHTLTPISLPLFFTNYFLNYPNHIFHSHLTSYFLQNLPHLPLIFFILLFIFPLPSQMIKHKNNKKH